MSDILLYVYTALQSKLE